MNKDNHNIANNYFTLLTEAKKLSDEQLDYFAQNPLQAALYARDTLKTEWDKVPNVPKDKAQKILNAIAKDVPSIYVYASGVMKRRWLEAESVLFKNPGLAIDYAEELIHKRWPELENIIKDDPALLHKYAIQIIKNRWPEAEPVIFRDPNVKETYIEFLNSIDYPEDED